MQWQYRKDSKKRHNWGFRLLLSWVGWINENGHVYQRSAIALAPLGDDKVLGPYYIIVK